MLSDRLAAGLAAAGIRPGDPVAPQLPDIPQFGILKAEGTAYCRERMAACKYPRVIDFPDELPGNTVGKVLESELVPAKGPRHDAER